MEETQKLSWQQLTEWGRDVESALGPLIDDAIKQEVIANVHGKSWQLWRIANGSKKTFLLFHVAAFSDGTSDLVLVAIDGEGINKILPQIMKIAKDANVKGVQFETHHSEKVARRLTAGYGFERLSTIFRAEL